MEMNYYIFFIAALVPMFIGFLWYGPLLGKAWMQQMGFTEESLKGGNMILIMILSYVFSLFIALILQVLVIHQMGVYSSILPSGSTELTGEKLDYFNDFLSKYGNNYRTFKHGVLHGLITSIFLVMPILAIQAMFEKKIYKIYFKL
ncbi:MAG: DUF1761 domain-containing protein, partial [Polaribacter sp.]|nr:DUF1761 domain-containing protein [Polaribacter sp.]